ncbi:MAG: EamA family transporter [Asgard group archaeon]|nr:EamA family transporter [Asgard group archaeon]
MKNTNFSFIRRIINTRPFTIFQAFFVTILWSSSWPIIKFGLKELPPLLFAGLRYIIASVILITIVLLSSKYRKEVKKISRSWWLKLVIYGLIFYTVTQGTQYIGLELLPAIDVSLLLSFTPMLVMILAIFLVKEIPNRKQIFFVFTALAGALLYFIPVLALDLSSIALIGLAVVVIGVIANALSTIMGRAINQKQELSPIVITAISMLFGSIILLIVGLVYEGIPVISLVSLGYILWLSIINTSFAFTLWNHAMQRLKAVEVSIINNTMLFQITILAVIFLSEKPTQIQWIGLVIVAISGLLLPITKSKKEKSKENQKQHKKYRKTQTNAMYNAMFYGYI